MGISITKGKHRLTADDISTLRHSNIGVRELDDQYILYYAPDSSGQKATTKHLLKYLLLHIRNDRIYNAYNDDFGSHEIPEVRIRPIIKN